MNENISCPNDGTCVYYKCHQLSIFFYPKNMRNPFKAGKEWIANTNIQKFSIKTIQNNNSYKLRILTKQALIQCKNGVNTVTEM